MSKKISGNSMAGIKKVSLLSAIGLVALVAVIVVNVVVWKGNRENKRQITGLNDQISQVERQIRQVPAAPAGTDAEMTAARDALAAAKTALPHSIGRNDVIDYIITEAEKCGVKVLPLGVEEITPGKTTRIYNELHIMMTVSGTLGNAESFINLLQGTEFPTLVVTGCTIIKSEPNDFQRAESDISVSIKLDVLVYTSIYSSEGDNAS